MNPKPLFKDIRFWILLAFALRLSSITHAPYEVGHNWRQSTVTMVARNFLEVDNNILYPRVDMAGEKTGITGMEFPVLNYSIYLLSSVFGYAHWYGRLIVLLAGSFGLWFFFRLSRRLVGQESAFYATLVLTVSLWFIYSRKVMPDVFALSLVLGGMDLMVSSWGKKRGRRWVLILLSSALIALGILAKLPAVVLLAFLVVLAFKSDLSWSRKLSSLAGLLFAPLVYMWYFQWVPFLVGEYGFWHFFMGKGLAEGGADLLAGFDEVLKHFYDRSLKFIGFAAFLFGVGVAIKKKDNIALGALALGFLAFVPVMIKGGDTFVRHDYYMLPFIPFLALIAGVGISSLPKQTWKVALMLVIAIEGIANRYHDFFPSENQQWIETLEEGIKHVIPDNALVAINSGEYPTPLYFAHRKGWTAAGDDLGQSAFIDSLKGEGLEYIIILEHPWGQDAKIQGEAIHTSEFWKIYKP